MTHMTEHTSLAELEAGLDHIRQAPPERGRVEMIVRRPAENEREILETAELSLEYGIVGDTWIDRPSSKTDDGGPHPEMQITVMNARAAALIAADREHWALAGDQLYVDLDIGDANLPPGTRLQVGEATLEVSAHPHTGCRKFRDRFGDDARRFVNSAAGRELNLRGINTWVVEPGIVRLNDEVVKLPAG